MKDERAALEQALAERLALGGYIPLASEEEAASSLEPQAGGIEASPGLRLDALPLDSVTAHLWQHPALGERAVVCLELRALLPGLEAELGALGFTRRETRPSVARGRRRVMGFPAQALLLDPARARYALEIMDDFRDAAGQIQTRPNLAKDAFHKIATRLGGSAPHFLPSFWEEAGRRFIELGNSAFGAMAFEKARTAEKEFGLKVDEQVRMEAFLEFTLAGAVSVKTLSSYARALEALPDPAQAAELFASLCIRRTRGGLPPYAGLAADLKRLHRRAAFPQQALDQTVRELLPASATRRAPAELWTTLEPSLLRIAAGSPEQKAKLLTLFPTPPSRPEGFSEKWLTLLNKAGALDIFLSPKREVSSPAPGIPELSPGRWFSQLVEWVDGELDALFPLLIQLAPTLKAAHEPLALWDVDSWRPGPDLDLVDLALELEVPLQAPPPSTRFQLRRWLAEGPDLPAGRAPARQKRQGRLEVASRDDDGARVVGSRFRQRDPRFVMADERFRGILQTSAAPLIGTEDFERCAEGMESLTELRRQWLLETLTRAQNVALPGLASILETLEGRTLARLLQSFPEGRPLLAGLDAAAALHRTLSGGLLDELDWPLFTAAWKELVAGDETPSVCGSFPFLILYSSLKAVVLGPAGRVLEQELSLPTGCSVKTLYFLQGALLLVYRDKHYALRARWCDGRSVEMPWQSGRHRAPAISLELANGETSWGGLPIKLGADRLPEQDPLFMDEDRAWSWREQDDHGLFVRLEPDGQAGPADRPPFVGDPPPEGLVLDLTSARLYPLRGAFSTSLLGAREGLFGWRRWQVPASEEDSDDEDWEEGAPPSTSGLAESSAKSRASSEALDGRSFHGTLDDGSYPSALLSLPGCTRPLPVVSDEEGAACPDTLALWDPDGTVQLQQLSDDKDFLPTASRLPIAFWHALSPSAVAVSTWLRHLTQAQAKALLTAARQQKTLLTQAASPPLSGSNTQAVTLVTPGTSPAGAEQAEKSERDLTEMPLLKHLPAEIPFSLYRGIERECLDAVQLEARIQALVTPATAEGASAQGDSSTSQVSDEALREALRGLYRRRWASGEVGSVLFQVGRFLTEGDPGTLNSEERPQTDLPWQDWVGRSRALAWLAIAPLQEGDSVRSLTQLLTLWAALPFSGIVPRLRLLEVRVDSPDHPLLRWVDRAELQLQDQWTLELEDGLRWLVTAEDTWFEAPHSLSILEAGGGTDRPLPAGLTVQSSRTLPQRDDRPWLASFLARLQQSGPPPFSTGQVLRLGAQVAEQTGISEHEARVLLLGLPGFSSYQNDFLGKELRSFLELKVKEATAARSALQELDAEALLQLLDSAAPENPAVFWCASAADESELAGRLAAAWKQQRGAQTPIPPEWLTLVETELDLPMEARALLQALLSSQQNTPFDVDGLWAVDPFAGLSDTSKHGAPFDGDALLSAVRLLSWGYERLPGRHPLRTRLATLAERVRQRLLNPNFLLPLGEWYFEPKERAKVEAALRAIEGTASSLDQEGEQGLLIDGGALVGGISSEYACFAFRPALLAGREQFVQAEAIARLTEDEQGRLYLMTISIWNSASFQELLASLMDDTLSEGRFAADPEFACPELLPEVQDRLGLSRDEARVYLALLILRAPTDRLIQQSLRIGASLLKRCSHVLVEKGLLIQATRARAGREVFLPGAWVAIKQGKDLPLERWKLPFYHARQDEAGRIQCDHEQLLLFETFRSLYQRAWRRYWEGDKPAFSDEGARSLVKGKR